MNKRVAVLLGVTAALTIGVSSSAAASGDPLFIEGFSEDCGKWQSCTDISAQQLLGPGVGDLVCTSDQQTYIPLYVGQQGATGPLGASITICKQ